MTTVTQFDAYQDGSGVTGTVVSGPYMYAATFALSVVLTQIRGPQAFGNRARRIRQWHAAQARKAFIARIAALGEDWLRKEEEFYGPRPADITAEIRAEVA